jgi:hypothetical protein
MTRATNGGLSGVATWTDSSGVSLHDPGYTDLIDARPERACLATVNGSGLPVLPALPVARAPAGVCASLCMKTSSQSRLVTTGSGAGPPRCNGYRAGLRREPPGLVAACRRDNARWYAHGPVTCVKICKPDPAAFSRRHSLRGNTAHTELSRCWASSALESRRGNDIRSF